MKNEVKHESVPAQFAAGAVCAANGAAPQAVKPDGPAALAAALDLLPNGLFLVERCGRIVFSNRAAAELLERGNGLRVVQGRLCADCCTTTARLWQLIGRAYDEVMRGSGPSSSEATGALKLPRHDGLLPLSVVVAPLRYRPNGSPEARQAGAAVFCSDPGQALETPQETLAGLYGFTPAETALVLALLGGHDLGEAARRLSMSLNTARCHLKHVFQKTGTNRQAELIRLVLSSPVAVRL